MMIRFCPDCDGNILMLPNNRQETYKGFIFTTPEIMVPTCKKCGEQFINKETANKIQEMLEKKFLEKINDD